MTILENFQNSREFPPGILATVDSRDFNSKLAQSTHTRQTTHKTDLLS